MVDFASAVWNQRDELVQSRTELEKLHVAVGRPSDLALTQWVQIYALVREFAPDLIVELGRGRGNSTCVFTTAVNRSGSGRVVSVGNDTTRDWEVLTVPRLRPLVPDGWFERLVVMQEDIMKADFAKILGDARRVVLFWDAHGTDLAYSILARILPLLQSRENLVLVHDMTDTDYSDIDRSYPDDRVAPKWAGTISSSDQELMPLYDFLSRNDIVFDTPGRSVERFLAARDGGSAQGQGLEELWTTLKLPDDIHDSHWLYFALGRGHLGKPIQFPPDDPGRLRLITEPEYWDMYRLFRESNSKGESSHPAGFSYSQVLFERSGHALRLSLDRNAYGDISNEELLLEVPNGPLILASSTTEDHVCSPFLDVVPTHTGERWVRIGLTFFPKKHPGKDAIFFLQDQDYKIFWGMPFDRLRDGRDSVLVFADIGRASKFRFSLGTLDGRSTYLPIGVRIEGQDPR